MAMKWFGEYMPILALVGLQLINSTNTIAIQSSTRGVSSMVFFTYTEGIGALILIPTTLLTRRKRACKGAMGLKGFSMVFFAALLGASIGQAMFYQGLKMVSASTASAVMNTIPATTFLLAAAFGMEKVQLKNLRSMAKVIGTIICVGGAIFMALFKGPQLFNMKSRALDSGFQAVNKEWLIGCMFLLGSSCCCSLWLILQVPICDKYLDPLPFSAWMCFLAFFQSAAITFFIERKLSAWIIKSTSELLGLFYVAIFGSCVTYYVQSWCISKKGPLFTSMFNPLSTVFVAIMAFFLLGEQLYVGSLIGAVAVVVGLYIVLWGKAKDYPTETVSCEDDDAQISIAVDESRMNSYGDMKKPLLH